MKYNEIPRVMQIAAVVASAMRRLGFAAEDIYFHVSDTIGLRSSDTGIFVTLRAQSNEYNYLCGNWPRARAEEAPVAWKKLCDDLDSHALSDAEFQRMYTARLPDDKFLALVATLKQKGFRIPTN